MKKLSKQKQKTWDILSTDTQTVEFKKFRELYGEFWLTEKRDVLLVSKMETSHVINAINMLERAGQTDTKSYLGLCKELTGRYKGLKYEN